MSLMLTCHPILPGSKQLRANPGGLIGVIGNFMPSKDKESVLFPVYTGHELYIIILPVRINWAIILANNGTLMTAKQRHLRAASSPALLPAGAPPNRLGPGCRPSAISPRTRAAQLQGEQQGKQFS